MDRIHLHIFFELLVLLSFVLGTLGETGKKSKTSCDSFPGYEPYKNERCLKLIDTYPVTSYQMAKNYCNADKAYLPTIDFDDKQRFVEELLKRKKINGSVWIGLNIANKRYQWDDATESHYRNWQAGHPKNDPAYCPQLKADAGDPNFGKWSYELCTEETRALMCEKFQRWSKVELQTSLINSIKNPVPVDFIYVQLPKEKPPTEIWSWMEWKDVSKEYNSTFFRVLGDKSANFGQVQPDGAPKLKFSIKLSWFEDKMLNNRKVYDPTYVPWKPEWSGEITFPWVKGNHIPPAFIYILEEPLSLRHSMIKHEITPRNMAMRLWKRVF